MPDRLTPDQIRLKLAGRPGGSPYSPYPEEVFAGPPRDAAILIPFTRIGNQWHILFIRRTENDNDRHGGQVAYPGGAVDPQDSGPRDAALREAQEEVGIAPQDVEILGGLPSFRSISNYLVRPFIGVFPWPYLIRPDPAEVERAFTIPLGWLADPANHEIQYREFPGYDRWPVLYFKPFDGELLWGFSARVTLRLLEVLVWGEPDGSRPEKPAR